MTMRSPRIAPGAYAAAGDALLAIDIDHFKRINDVHGHAVGDQVLCRLVAAMGARKRSGDLLFRTGVKNLCCCCHASACRQRKPRPRNCASVWHKPSCYPARASL